MSRSRTFAGTGAHCARPPTSRSIRLVWRQQSIRPKSGRQGPTRRVAYCVPSSSRSFILLVNKLRSMRWVTIGVFGLLLAPLLHDFAAGAEVPDPFVHP